MAAALVLGAILAIALAAPAPGKAWAGKPYDVTAPEGAALASIVGKAESFVGWLRTPEGQAAVKAGDTIKDVSGGLAFYSEWEEDSLGDLTNLWWGDYYADGTATGHDASSWEDIGKALARHYAGEIDLTDSEKYPGFAVGVIRNVSLSAMLKSGTNDYGDWSVGESHGKQNVQLVIMDKNKYALSDATAAGDKRYQSGAAYKSNYGKAAFIVGQCNSLNEMGYMNKNGTNSGSWNDSDRRAWCNSAYRAALPGDLRDMLKQVDVVTAQTYSGSTNQVSQDWCFLPAEKEAFGSSPKSNTTEANALEQWNYYATVPKSRIKYTKGSNKSWWERSPYMGSLYYFCYVSAGGEDEAGGANGGGGLAPCCCI